MSYQTDTYFKQEADKDKKLHDRYIDSVYHRLKVLITKENAKGRVPPVFRSKFMTTPKEVFERSFVRISLASLYRRYRAIYIQALSEAIAIAQKYDSKEEVLKHMRHKIIEAGMAEKEARKELNSGGK